MQNYNNSKLGISYKKKKKKKNYDNNKFIGQPSDQKRKLKYQYT